MITVDHTCAGPACVTCAMCKRGYVRSAVVNRWWKPDQPGAPWLTDEQAREMLQLRLRLFEEVG